MLDLVTELQAEWLPRRCNSAPKYYVLVFLPQGKYTPLQKFPSQSSRYIVLYFRPLVRSPCTEATHHKSQFFVANTSRTAFLSHASLRLHSEWYLSASQQCCKKGTTWDQDWSGIRSDLSDNKTFQLFKGHFQNVTPHLIKPEWDCERLAFRWVSPFNIRPHYWTFQVFKAHFQNPTLHLFDPWWQGGQLASAWVSCFTSSLYSSSFSSQTHSYLPNSRPALGVVSNVKIDISKNISNRKHLPHHWTDAKIELVFGQSWVLSSPILNQSLSVNLSALKTLRRFY